jgi:methyl-accepting chemotaxis protein
LDQIAKGDLLREVPPEYHRREDEIGTLAKSMQTMTTSLRAMVQEISGNIDALSSSATELLASASNMTSGCRRRLRQSSFRIGRGRRNDIQHFVCGRGPTNLSNVSSSTEQMTTTIGEIAANSERARRITEDATRQTVDIGPKDDATRTGGA